jgi:hypothetical protein
MAARHATRTRRGRGQNAILEAGLALAIAASVLGVLTVTIQGYSRAQSAIAAGDLQARLASSVGGYVRSNYQAFLNAFTGGTTCGGAATPGGVIVFPLDSGGAPAPAGELPNNQGSAGTTCEGIGGLIATGTPLVNGYQQHYQLVVNEIAPPGGQPYLTAILTTTGGQTLNDDMAALAAKRIGSAGAILPSVANQPILGALASGTAGQFKLDPAAWGGTITPGHPLVYLDYALATGIDENLQRYSSAADAGSNKMSATLYMNGTDSATGGPVNMALNGPAIPNGTALAIAALAGGGTLPRNALLGARQVDTQTLTGGSSVGNAQVSDAAQAGVEIAAGQTSNEGANPAFAGHTILANANLNITSGYRLSSADSLHIIATQNTYPTDVASSPNGAYNAGNPTGTAPQALNNHQGDAGAAIVPGVTWDRANFTGLMAYYGTAPQGPGPNQFWLATYAGTPAYNGVVGFEADGGIRAPVYYDSKNANYYLTPAGDSVVAGSISAGVSLYASQYVTAGLDLVADRNLVVYGSSTIANNEYVGNTLTAGQNVNAGNQVYAGQTVESGCNIYADPATYWQEYAMPVYETCGNVNAWDAHAAGSFYANNDFRTYTGHLISEQGYAQVGLKVTIGQYCGATGQIAINSADNTAAWCQNNIWTKLGAQIFQNYQVQQISQCCGGGYSQSGTNNTGGPMMMTTNCNNFGPAQGAHFDITITDNTANVETSHARVGNGGSDSTFQVTPFVSAIIPSGHNWTVNVDYRGSGQTAACYIVTLD